MASLALLGVSVLVLCYYWENWRSAREMTQARQRLIERAGTDDPFKFMRASLADEDNFFALPEVSRWATEPLFSGSRFHAYVVPEGTLLPKGFTPPELIEDAHGIRRADFAGWLAQREAGGQKIPASDLAAAVVDRELGDANGLLPKLAAGLNRPFSSLKPTLAESMAAADDSKLFYPDLPRVVSLNKQEDHLALHLRAAAHAGNSGKARQTALICLRLFPESASMHGGGLITILVGIASFNTAFSALQDALSCPVWDEASLRQIQQTLAQVNDLEAVERNCLSEVLWIYTGGLKIHELKQKGDFLPLFKGRPQPGNLGEWFDQETYLAILRLCPTGWIDANFAFQVNCLLDSIGPRGDTAWMNGSERGQAVRNNLPHGLDFRHNLFPVGFPEMGRLFPEAAKTLFHRRCLIIACALEHFRIKTGAFPSSLKAVEDELKPYDVNDPARPQQLPGYRLEEKGYFLWSAGPDGRDDGGSKERDWLWSMHLSH